MLEFYNYISKIIIEYLSSISLNSGERYSIQLENLDEVEGIYTSLKGVANEKELLVNNFIYESEVVQYSTYYITLNNVKLVVAKTDVRVNADFLTHLRNSVDKSGTVFEKTALLFIHNTNLDSILGGAKRLEVEGMPLHVDSIEKSLRLDVERAALKSIDKQIILLYLENNKSNVYERATSIFDFQDLFDVLETRHIKPEKYKDFGLFFDEKLDTFYNTFDDQSLKRRIISNFDLYKTVDEIHKYSEPSELEKHFEKNGVEKLKRADWCEVDYEQVLSSNQLFKDQANPVYIEEAMKNDNPEYVIWDRAEGDSKSKLRKRHLIIFNEKHSDIVTLKLRFDTSIKKDEVKSSNKKNSVKSNGKIIEVEFSNCKYEVNHLKLTYYKTTFNIMVMNVRPEFVQEIADKYFVKADAGSLFIVDDAEELELNKSGTEVFNVALMKTAQTVNVDETQMIVIQKNFNELEDIEEVRLDVCVNEYKIPFLFINEKSQSIKISALDVWKQKNLFASNFNYEVITDSKSKRETVKLSMGTKTYYPTGEFRRLLDIENKHIEIYKDSITFQIVNGVYLDTTKELPEILIKAYLNVKEYFRNTGTLPSLTYFDDKFVEIARNFINLYFGYLFELEYDTDMSKEQYKRISDIGVIYEFGDEKRIHFSPLHPLKLAYQLRLKELLQGSDLIDDVLSSISNNYLVPYIRNHDEELFKPIETELIEWTTYVNFRNSKHNASNRYVPRIVSSKIKDFCSHFDYLFSSEYAPIKVAVVNLGDCHQVLEGVFDFYVNELKTKKIDELRPMEIQVYDDKNTINAFEELSTYTDIEEIKEIFNLKFTTERYEPIDIMAMYSNKVHFYKRKTSDFEYCHVTFYKMNDEVKIGHKNMFEIQTGLSLGGVNSAVSSVFVGDEYVTGFGVKNLNYKSDDFLKFVMFYNSFVEYINNLATFDFRTVLATAISSSENKLLQKIYKESHWITFIDPKVDLNYFKSCKDTKDLMIIHYSDQYSSSNGYDAITVTQKSDIYSRIIESYLMREAHLNPKINYDIKEIINSFNVFNGEWLLRLITRQKQNKKDQFAKEKLSLFSAVKLLIAKTLHSNVFWIPISFEEIVRVSGATGLSQKDSIFSPKKFGYEGSFSDDLLMIGIQLSNDGIRVCYYPVEVKIGNNASDVLVKARSQVIQANEYLSKILEGETFHTKLLRNKLMQMCIIQIKKIKLYDLWSDKQWGLLLNDDVLNKLIDDDYSLVSNFDQGVNDCGVVTFTKSAIVRRHQVQEYHGFAFDHLDYPMQDAYVYLALDIMNVIEINNWVQKLNGEKQIIEIPHSVLEADDILIQPTLYDDSVSMCASTSPSYGCTNKEIKIVFGTSTITNEEITWLPNASDKVMHTNTGIIGTMGTGKTQFTKSLITQLKLEENNNVNALPIGILIFDYKGDYIKSDFVNANHAMVYNLYELPFNPLSIYEGKTFRPMLPLHIANELRDTISKAYSLGPVQKNTLSDVLEEAYSSVGIIPTDRTTWSKSAPTIDTVYRTYINAENPTNDSLYAALNELYKFRIFESDPSKTKPLFDLVQGVMVINLSGYSESIQNLVVAITLDTFYAQMQAQGHSAIDGNRRQLTKFILVDEADNFLSKNFNSVKKILKEGREFGVGTILSTQFLKHFSAGENRYSEYILTWVIHKVNEISGKEVGGIFSESDKNTQDKLVDVIKNLEKHYSIINLGGDNQPKHIKDRAFWELTK